VTIKYTVKSSKVVAQAGCTIHLRETVTKLRLPSSVLQILEHRLNFQSPSHKGGPQPHPQSGTGMGRTCTLESSERLSRTHPKLWGHITKAGADRVDAKDGMAVDDGMRAGQLYAESHACLFCSRYQNCGGLLKQVDGRGSMLGRMPLVESHIALRCCTIRRSGASRSRQEACRSSKDDRWRWAGYTYSKR
jgi:hypothetical protein